MGRGRRFVLVSPQPPLRIHRRITLLQLPLLLFSLRGQQLQPPLLFATELVLRQTLFAEHQLT